MNLNNKIRVEEDKIKRLKSSLNKVKKIPIGSWGFITGSSKALESYWKEYYPRGIFGKVIDYQVQFNTYVLTIRAVNPRSKQRNHYHVSIENFKPYEIK